MSELINSLRTKNTTTLNGAVTNSSSLDSVLDLFFIAGASRNRSEEDIKIYLEKAFLENPEKALKVVFWAGDIRKGAGERRFFKIALKFLSENYPDTFNKNIKNVPEFNRWDSLFEFGNNLHVMNEVTNSLLVDQNGLLAKWMPREGKKNHQEFRKQFQKHNKLNSKEYRKLVVSKTDVVEQLLSAKEFDQIEYSHVPSVAFKKYVKSFYRNDEEGIKKFLEKVEKGEAKINASSIFPHDILRAAQNGSLGSVKALELQWDALPNYLEGSKERILPVCDVSGSMSGLPMDISVSLGIYISERNEGIFKDAFMTFSEKPQLQYLKGSLLDRIKQLMKADWGMSTNLQSVFELILDRAESNKISQEEMPTKILIISDMEFNVATDRNKKTNFEKIQKLYRKAGYEMPQIIFWNVNSRSDNSPVTFNEDKTALISGASPSVIKSVLSGEVNPLKVLAETCFTSRYDSVKY